MRFHLVALLIALSFSTSCRGPEDPLYPDLDLPVLGTVGMHARDLPEPRVVVNLFSDGRLTVDGRAVEPGELGGLLTAAADLSRDLEDPWRGSLTSLVIRTDRRVEWDRVRFVIRAGCDPDVRIFRHYLAVTHEGDGEEGTFQFRFPGFRQGDDHFLPDGDYVRVASRFTVPAPPEAIVVALGTPRKAVFVEPHPGAAAGYILRLLDALVRTGREEISLGWGTEETGAAPFGMRLNGDPVPSTSVDLPTAPRSTGIVGIEFPSWQSATRFADGRAIDRLVVRTLENGGSREEIAAVRARLAAWADRQHDDGYWEVPGESRIRTTAVVLLGFLGAGRTNQHGEYGKVVRHGLRFFKQIQRKDGLYSEDPADHAAATWAMAKAYAMTRSPLFKQSAAKAVGSLAPGGGAWTVLARAEGALAELGPASVEEADARAALREVLAEPIPETDPRRNLSISAKWLLPAEESRR